MVKDNFSVDGIVLVDKPKGWTSFDVVAKIRGNLKRETGLKKPKVGHTGTLDPLATGLMIVVTGKYTKRAQEFSKLDKVYEVAMELGKTSTTGDAEGVISKMQNAKGSMPSQDELLEVLASFVGGISQTPPVYSAIKVNGQRAYELARKGKEVKLEPRQVTIFDITDIEYDYPVVKFTAHVSSGTYIRSLVEDIGNKLGVGAYMTELRRTKVGSFNLSDAVQVDDFESNNIKQVPEHD